MVSRYFVRRREDAARGRIEISNERYLLIRAASLSLEFFNLVREILGAGREREADLFAQDLVYDLAHALGKTDARRFHAWSQARDPISRLACGPVHFAHTGWAEVEIDPRSLLVANPDYFMIYTHHGSFEAETWVEGGRRPELPVCIMNAGYSSGWCEESFGLPLVAVEIHCRARGDDACRFLMAPPRRIEERLQRHFPEVFQEGKASIRVPDFFVRQRLEEELRRSREDLERRVAERTAELIQLNQRLQEEIRARQQVEQEALQAARWEAVVHLAGGIAHDFNNLMGVVVGEASLLEASLPADSPVRAAVGRMREAGQVAANLTRQLIDFSRPALQKTAPLEPGGMENESRPPMAAAGIEAGSSAKAAPVAAGSGETILMVEDQAALRRMFEQMLSSCGYRVLSSGDPGEALRWLSDKEKAIALLLTDVVMPGMSGRDLAERALALRPGLKVLFMSGYPDDDETLCQGIKRGQAELLVKPFTPSQLSERLRHLLDS
ncbi:MAG: response regulator [Myxococcales bacterium]|nr:response regulator [Myxococcales bacterium]